jgi:hypothetical protein
MATHKLSEFPPRAWTLPTEFAPAMADDAPVLPGLSPVGGKSVHLTFDGGRLSSDAGVLVLAEIERRLGLAERRARCIEDPRAPERVRHGLAEMIRFRAPLIAAGDPDGNDCDFLRADPAFKLAVGRLPETGAELCSQPTMSRLENLPSATALKRTMAAPRRPPGRRRCANRIDRLLTVDGGPVLRQLCPSPAPHRA